VLKMKTNINGIFQCSEVDCSNGKHFTFNVNIVILCFKGFHVTSYVFKMSFSGGGKSRDQYKGVTGRELGLSLTCESIKLIFKYGV
jgi:hypothetical protein